MSQVAVNRAPQGTLPDGEGDPLVRASNSEAAAPRLTACCLVNHFNYAEFVGEALTSVMEQSRPLDDVLVVDDGSDQDQLEALRAAASACRQGGEVPRVLAKENGGQLSCFAAGLEATDAEIVFFLDADDLWEPSYVERVMEIFESRPDIDFVACNETRFRPDGTSEVTPVESRDLGYSMVRALERGGAFLGKPTSCLAIRRTILERIFPLPMARGWKTCADEALVYGSSLVGARKYLIGDPLVRYRVHGNNHFFGRRYCAEDRLRRGVEVLRMVEVLRQRQGLPESLAHLAHHEFRTIERPDASEYRAYIRALKHGSLPGYRRRRIRLALFAWFRLGRRI